MFPRITAFCAVVCVAFLVVIATASAQQNDFRITFTGWDNVLAAPVPLDSVRVRDMSLMKDTVLLDPFILDVIVTGLDNPTTVMPGDLNISSAFANPFYRDASFAVTCGATPALTASLYAIDGRRVAHLTLPVAAGVHSFVLHGAGLVPGAYVLAIGDGGAERSVRLIKRGARASGGISIEYASYRVVDGPAFLGKPAIPVSLRCTGFATGFTDATVDIAPIADTTVRFLFQSSAHPPCFDSFVADTYSTTPGAPVHFELHVHDAGADLSRTLIDFEGNGVFDDSASVSDAAGISQFTHTYSVPGTYVAHACVRDLNGSTRDTACAQAVIVVQNNTAPTIESFDADRYTAAVGDTVRYTVTSKDAEGNLRTVWIDYDGNGVQDDSAAVSGTDAVTHFSRKFAAAGSYTAKARVADAMGLGVDRTLASPVVITAANTKPSITAFTADKLTKLTDDTVQYSITWTDGDGNAEKVWIDYDGNGTWDDMVQVSGGSGSAHFATVLTVPGSYPSKSRIMDADGQTGEKSLAAPVVVSQAPPLPTINTIAPTAVCQKGDLTIGGQHFGATRGNSIVQFKGGDVGAGTNYLITASTYVTWNDSMIVVLVPGGVKLGGVVYVVVNNRRGNEFPFQIAPTPVLTTATITYISSTAATGGGTITADGGAPVTARGICWGTTTEPLITDAKAVCGSGTGSFTGTLTGLAPSTTYHVRAFASNASCTSYGSVVTFTTSAPPPLTVTIGTQVWMGSNLDVVTYRNGDTIPEVRDPKDWAKLKTGAWCWYNNDAALGGIYGRLYNWYAVNDPRGLAPVGWHVPSDTDWTVLVTYLGGNTLAGGKLKEAGTSHWNAPNNGSFSSGFTGLPGGYRWYDGTPYFLQTHGYFWSTTPSTTTDAWARFLRNNVEEMFRSATANGYGLSVRCVKDN